MKKTLTIITMLIAFTSGFALHRIAIYRSVNSPIKLRAELVAERKRANELEANYLDLKSHLEKVRSANEKTLADYTASKKGAELINQKYKEMAEQLKNIIDTGKDIPPNIEEVILKTSELEHQLPKPLLKELQKYPAFKDFQEMLLRLRKRPAVL